MQRGPRGCLTTTLSSNLARSIAPRADLRDGPWGNLGQRAVRWSALGREASARKRSKARWSASIPSTQNPERLTPREGSTPSSGTIKSIPTTLFAALNVKTGQVLGQTRARHRAVEFRKFLDLIDAHVPADLDIHLILDNDSTHKTALIRRWFAKRPRYQRHFTPTYGSWINMVERWFAGLTTKQLRRGVHRSVAALEQAIRDDIDAHNVDGKPFVWTKNADEILASIARFAARTLAAQA